MSYKKRLDGREIDEPRKIECKVGVVPRADGSAMFRFGDTIAIAAVYGPKELHPKHLENPEGGLLRCYYNMLSFSVSDRIRPGPSRRSSEISLITKESLAPVLQLEGFPNKVVDVHIEILQANAGTRCAGINAASMALAHAGIPMTDLVAAVSVGKIGDAVVVDLTKEEEDYEENGKKAATDIPVAFLLRSGKLSLLQADGKIPPEDMKKAIEMAQKACIKIGEEQKKALKALK
jgi:exosome complex component RRP41